MHALKLGDIEAFPFVEPPDGRYVRDGQRTLREINALSDDGKLTEMGRRLARLPLDPRLGRILLAGVDERCLEEVAIIAAALSVPDPRDRPADKQTQADQKHALLRDENSDFLSLLKLWRAYAEQREHLSRAKLRGWCRDNFLSYLRLTEWHDVHGQVMEVVKGELALKLNGEPAKYEAIHRALLAGLLSQVAQRKEQAEYLGANGTKLHIHPGSGQFKAKPPWIVSAEQVETTKVYARNVARVEPLWIEQVGEHLVRRQHYDPHWERRAARASVYERTTLFGLTLTTDRRIALRADRSEGGARAVHPACTGPDGIRQPRAVPRPQPAAAGGHRVPAAEGPARGPAGRREPAVRILRCARAGGHLHRRGVRELAQRSRGASNPKLLWLTEARHRGQRRRARDRHNSPITSPPDRWWCSCATASSPGHEDDGVSAIVPLHVLNQLPEEPFAWLVPGLFEEKLTALVRSLPKNLRVHFVPVPEAVARVLPLLDQGRGSLPAQLADALSRTGGVRVPRDSFREDVLPPHLRMNFLLVDDAQKVIARSRSLRGAARPACRRLGAGLCEAVAAHHRRTQLGVRRSAGADRCGAGRAQAGGLSRAGRRGRDRRAARIRHAARGAHEP